MNKYEMKQKAYQSTLKSRALQVLVYLIDRSNKEGTCFPAITTMSRELHISVSTVKRSLRELTESGFVKKESRFREKNKGQTSNLYILCFIEKNEAIVEEKVGEGVKNDVKDFSTRKQIIKQEKKQIVKVMKLSAFFIPAYRMWVNCIYLKNTNIFAAFYYKLYWTGEAVNLIPP